VTAVPLGLMASAGAAAAFNPCGAALLPGYVAWLLGHPSSERRGTWLGRALGAGACLTAAFLAVFGAFALLGSAAAATLGPSLRWVAAAVGLGLVVAAARQALGRTDPGPAFGSRLARAVAARPRSGWPGVFAYGVGYALASLGCTLPLFLALVAAATASGSPAQAAEALGAWAMGMGAVATALAVLALGSREVLATRLRAWVPRAERVAALVLGAVGLYVLYYWLLGPGAGPRA